MGSSNSDTENEYFESAEESLSENDESDSMKIKLNISLSKSENKVSKPVVSNSDAIESEQQGEEIVSNNLLSYRKRPERVKRSISKPSSRSPPKSLSNELKLKADRIVPDIFFQDITSNLSKNINKSLNTLQQTSSNVKDLILSSLPVSSASGNESFAYDDKRGYSSSANENELSIIESNPQTLTEFEAYQSVSRSSAEVKEKIVDKKLTCLQKEQNLFLVGEVSNNDIVREQLVKKTGSVVEENCEMGSCNADGGEKEISICKKNDVEKPKNTFIVSDLAKKAAGDDCKEKMKSMVEKTEEYSQVLNKISLNQMTPYRMSDLEENEREEIIKQDLVKFSSKVDQKIEKSEKTENLCSKISKPVEILNEGPHSSQKACLEPADEKLNVYETNFICVEVNKDKGCLIGNSEEKNFCDLLRSKEEVNSKCNFEELKLVLKNIVQEEISAQNINQNLGNEFPKEDCNLEEKVNIHQSSNDGWDDFDFSDDDFENFNQKHNEKFSETENKNSNKKTENKEVKISQINSATSAPEMQGKKPEDSGSSSHDMKKNLIFVKEHSTEVKGTDLTLKKKNDFKEKNCKKIEKPKQLRESVQEFEDSWDWDNWNENVEDMEDKIQIKATEKPLFKKNVDNFFDVSKWSGWDTFGQKAQEKQGNWNLGSWGVDAFLNKATAVTQGISNVLEAGLGAPDPETLARLEKQERERLKDLNNENILIKKEESPDESSKSNSPTNVGLFPVSGITSLVVGVTSKIVEHSKIQEIGSKVITGGLDTLETLGKKTMEVLQEGDPGLKNKSALFLGKNKPILSQVLREAREKAEKEMKKVEEKELAKKCHFETLFDDFQGMVHLEALEMLSRQCELKLDQIKSGMNLEELEDLNGVLEEVEQLCSLDEYDIDLKSSVIDFKTTLQMAVTPLKNEISVQRIIQIHEDANKWLKMASETDSSVGIINQKLVSTLAELAAATVHQFHKSGELLSVKECRKTVEEVDALSRLTHILCKEINRLCDKFVLLSHATSCKEITTENVFNEKVAVVMQSSIWYIRQAFDLLIPVIQLGAAV